MAPLPLLLLALAAAPAPLPPDEEARRDALARYGLGVWNARTEHLTQAVKQLRASAEKDPKAAAPHRELAHAYADLGRDASAIRECREALALDPDDFASARLLGKLLMEGHKYAEAVEAYRAASLAPAGTREKFANWCDLARAAAKANDPKWTTRALDMALRMADPDLGEVPTPRTRDDLLKPGAYTAQELDRKRVELWESLGEAHTAWQAYAAAVFAYEKARDLSLDKAGANLPNGVARIHLNLSKVLAAKGDAAAAVAELGKYLAFLPASVAPYERYAELLKAANPRANVLPALRAFERGNPRNTALPWLVAAEAMAADERGAAAAFVPLLQNGTADADAFRLLVKGHLASERHGALLTVADDLARAARPPEPDPDANSAPAARRPQDPDAVERVRLLHAAIKAAPKAHTAAFVAQLGTDARESRVRAHDTLELVTFLAARDNQQAALAAALLQSSTVRNGTAPPETFELLFEVLRERRQWEELRKLAEEAKGKPAFRTRLSPYTAVADACAELGEERQCLAADDVVIASVVARGRVGVLLRKARHLAQFGRAKEALKICEDVRAEFPTDTARRQVAVVEADVYHRQRDHAKAEGLLRDVLADDPDDAQVLNNLGYNLADQGRKLPEAEAMIRRAIALDTDARLRVSGSPEAESGTYLDSLGWVLLRRGEAAKAVEALAKAANLPDAAGDPIVWDHLGDALYRVGRRPEAKAAWTKAVALYTGSRLGSEGDRLNVAKGKLELP